MLHVDELAQHCNMRTFQRARQIAEKNRNILTKQVRYNEDETALSAFVAASSGWNDRYRVNVVIDEVADEVVDYSCTCPAFLKYDGMCKHTVALAMTFIDDPRSFMGYKASRAPETSPSIAEFMRRAERIAREEEAGLVSIDTTLTYNYGSWEARFKLRGPRGSYVMKSIGEFVAAMRNGSHVTYGKNLAFTHTPGMLDDHARAVARFLERAVAQRELANESLYFRALAPSALKRDLELTEAELIELLDTLQDTSFEVKCDDATLRSRMMAHIVQGDPDIALRILRNERGGYTIARDEDIVFAAVAERMYVVQDDMFFRCTPAFARCADFLRNVYRSSDSRLFITAEDMPLFCATALPLLEKTLTVQAPPELELMRPMPAELSFYFDKVGDLIETSAHVAYGARSFTLIDSPTGRERAAALEKEQAEGAAGTARDAGAGEARYTASDDGHVFGAVAPDKQAEGAAPAPTGAAPGSTAADAAPPNAAPANTPFAPLRDEVLEARAVKLVHEYFAADATLPVYDEDASAALLFGGLARFRALGEVYTTPAFDRLISDKKPRVQMGLSLAGNLIDLDVSSDDLESDELAALLASYRQRKRFHRLRSGAFLNLADFDAHELERMMSDLGITPDQLAGGHIELPTYSAFYLDREFADAHRDASFTSYVERFRAIDQASYRAPESLGGVLRPYQQEGFGWLSALVDMGFGGILADEMGLGKSIQLISLLLARKDEAREVGPSLIVCPASLVFNWLAEFAAFAPELAVRAVEGTKAERARIRREPGIDVLVTSYDLARADIEAYEGRRFYSCVLDEAQYVKNHATLTTRAVKRIDAAHRIALTGTPMENRLSEIWSIFDFLMPGFLGSYARFRERYELDILGGNEDTARRLQSLVGPFILRRLKSSVLPDLPDKIDSTVYVPLPPEQRKVYAAFEQQLRTSLGQQKKEKFAKSKVEVLAELTKLRQIALDPSLLLENYHGPAAKMAAIMDLVEQSRDAGTKALVFSQFTSYLSLIASELDARGMPYFTITGATPKKDRLAKVNAFNEDDTPVFLVSLKAGGTGLNLTGASVVIHADPWWNAAATNQATDRAHRIGQQNVVSVYKVIAKGTIEERILALQQAKCELADSVIGEAGTVSLSKLTQEELLDLLEG